MFQITISLCHHVHCQVGLPGSVLTGPAPGAALLAGLASVRKLDLSHNPIMCGGLAAIVTELLDHDKAVLKVGHPGPWRSSDDCHLW